MKVNTKVRYGLRAMLQIAQAYGGDPVPISAISQTQEISSKYLEQVVGVLRKSGLITSRKGVRGGYSLTRPPAEINLWDVIQALDPHSALVDCVNAPDCCDRSENCLTRNIWTLLSDQMRIFWSGFSLQTLADKMEMGPTEISGIKLSDS